MSSSQKYLTKSTFKICAECPRKLYYHQHPEIYANQVQENPFLESLAEGGHQIGKMAQVLIEGGTLVSSRGHSNQIEETNQLLEDDNAIIYEAAINFGDHFIRIDILKKSGNNIELIEVKAKSYSKGTDFYTKKGYLEKGWFPYLDDVAYQTWVLNNAHPEWNITPSLMLVNKDVTATIDNLHQLFRIEKTTIRGRVGVEIKNPDSLSAKDLGRPILKQIDVTKEVELILSGEALQEKGRDIENCAPMAERAKQMASQLLADQDGASDIGAKCNNCQFTGNNDNSLESGFDKCWTERFPDFDPKVPCVSQLWNYRRTDKMVDKGIWRMDDIPDLKNIQLIQKEIICDEGSDEWVSNELKPRIDAWEFPLHFIDFETAAVAVPFHADMKPYQTIAFQFSCHHLFEDGTITHEEFISTNLGEFPSYEFLKALRKAVGDSGGTILRYHAHENTVLRHIRKQIVSNKPAIPADMCGVDYIEWIDSITHPSGKEDGVTGKRDMVDMYPFVKEHYYHKRMGSKKSIKNALDAIMASSSELKEIYSKPLKFGTNLLDYVMYQEDEAGITKDPYKILPSIHNDIDDESFESFQNNLNQGRNKQFISDGGAALAAYAKMQLPEMGDQERREMKEALLRYCELDTLAMVMLWQHWKSC